MQRNYWDIDEILAEGTLVPARIKRGTKIYGVTHLVPSLLPAADFGPGSAGSSSAVPDGGKTKGEKNPAHWMNEKTELKIPLWLAVRMAPSHINPFDFLLPPVYCDMKLEGRAAHSNMRKSN